MSHDGPRRPGLLSLLPVKGNYEKSCDGVDENHGRVAFLVLDFESSSKSAVERIVECAKGRTIDVILNITRIEFVQNVKNLQTHSELVFVENFKSSRDPHVQLRKSRKSQTVSLAHIVLELIDCRIGKAVSNFQNR